MTNGYLMLTRDKENSGIYLETTEDWMDIVEENNRRVLYCQAVADVEQVQQKLDQWLQEMPEMEQEDINDQIAEIISSIQWIANEHPLQCFRPYSVKEMFS